MSDVAMLGCGDGARIDPTGVMGKRFDVTTREGLGDSNTRSTSSSSPEGADFGREMLN